MVATISDLGRSRPIRADCSQWSAMLFRQGRFFRLVVTHNSNNRKVERIKAFHLRNWSKTELIPFPNACRRGRTVTIEFVKLDKHSRFTVEPFWFLQRTGKLQRICRRFRQRSFPESKWHLLLAGKPFSIGFSLKFLRFLRLIIIQKFVNFEHRRVCSQAVIFSWKVERSTGRRRLEGSGIVVRIIWGFIVRKRIVQTLKFLFELQCGDLNLVKIVSQVAWGWCLRPLSYSDCRRYCWTFGCPCLRVALYDDRRRCFFRLQSFRRKRSCIGLPVCRTQRLLFIGWVQRTNRIRRLIAEKRKLMWVILK